MNPEETKPATGGAPDAEVPGDGRESFFLPADALLILPLRTTVIFPGTVVPLTAGRSASVRALDEAVRREVPIGVIAQRDPAVNEPGPTDLFEVGTAAEVQRLLTTPDGQRMAVARGRQRFQVVEFLREKPFLAARVKLVEEKAPATPEFEARVLHLRQEALQALSLLPQEMPELRMVIEGTEDPLLLLDLISSVIATTLAEKQELLEILDPAQRILKLAEKLAHQIEVLSLTRKIGTEAREAIDESQREYFLRQQLKAIQKELGEDDPRATETAELRRRIEEARMPPETEKQALSELERFERMHEAAAEASVVRTYLEWLIEMPWNTATEEKLDIEAARAALDVEHHGLEKVKKRILELLAVRKLKPEGKSPILCFIGPPGVGKTSLGRSIAQATNRKFVRQSLGGIHDEAEIRGHRRTYVGAMPGRIIQGIRRAGSRNPVFMLDEVDKLSASLQGDPAAALLEVLDPEQNATFEDHYLDVPFDLRQVLFITTANVAEGIPPPLRDRMEVIELPGYMEEEKLEIARRHLIPRQIEANGLKEPDVRFAPEAVQSIVREYTREAGVRQLERELGAVCRAVATRFAGGDSTPVAIDTAAVRSKLGPPRFFNEVALRTSLTGVATGLAWTPQGGEILFVEATRMPGKGELILTGQLGDVMQESARAALSLVMAHARELGIPDSSFRKSDIHIHIPSGAIPKDGPSAGITLFTALVSLLTGRRVRRDVALTGEISLRGLVLPVGGIKDKVLAAHRAGIPKVILPKLNEKDLEEIPQALRKGVEFEFLERVDEVLDHAIEKPAARRGAARERKAARKRPVAERTARAR